jgi:hypothetical protein
MKLFDRNAQPRSGIPKNPDAAAVEQARLLAAYGEPLTEAVIDAWLGVALAAYQQHLGRKAAALADARAKLTHRLAQLYRHEGHYQRSK